jgi:hypothetical protein
VIVFDTQTEHSRIEDGFVGGCRAISWHGIADDCIYNQYIVNHLKSKDAVASRADITALKDGVLRALWIKKPP